MYVLFNMTNMSPNILAFYHTSIELMHSLKQCHTYIRHTIAHRNIESTFYKVSITLYFLKYNQGPNFILDFTQAFLPLEEAHQA